MEMGSTRGRVSEEIGRGGDVVRELGSVRFVQEKKTEEVGPRG